MHSIRFQLTSFITTVLLILLVLLNTYPIISSRDRVFEEKRNSMSGQAAVVASSLANLDSPNDKSIAEVLRLLDIRGFERIAVVDSEGKVLYDDRGAVGIGTDIDDIKTALKGKTVFRSKFADSAFESCFAMPMHSGGENVGAVYISEHDTERAEIIMNIQGRIHVASLIIAGGTLLIAVIFSDLLLKRLRELVRSMRIVAGGDYAHRLATRGRDEITELGNEFNILTERLETTERQRRQFVSDASHELKTPLASIRLLSDSIVQSENIKPETVREFVTDIGQEAERLQRTTEKLLDLSRLDDDIQVVPEPVDVKQVTLDALVLLRPLAQEKGVRMRSELEDGCVIMASVDDIFHIVFNLVENAIKYNVEGGKVILTLKTEGDSVKITVADTGIGIPEEDRLNIFSRFYRVDKARSREAGGSGLGLSIVHDAVQLHGGSIAVGVNRPQGSKFIVSFPKAKPEETGI
ncbi:MAG: sensor histidine kinase [Candidatus Limivicinus sp.]|jgi:signal transduction histidine kinase